MNEQDWKISVEKKLTAIQKDIEFIKCLFEDGGLISEKNKKLKGRININTWLIGGLFTGIIAIVTTILGKLQF